MWEFIIITVDKKIVSSQFGLVFTTITAAYTGANQYIKDCSIEGVKSILITVVE